MVQIVRDVSAGEKLGTGLGEGLKMLASNYFDQMQARQAALKRAHGIEALLPQEFTPEKALAAAYAPESILKEYTKRKLLEPSQRAYLKLLQQQMGQGEGEPAQELPPDLAEAGITEQQATKLSELGMKKQEQKAADQRHYEKLFNKKIESIENEGKAASRAYAITKRMSDIIKKDKAQLGSVVSSGIGSYRFVPQQWLAKDTQELISLGNDLVLKKAQLGKGVPTRFRLAMEELAKPAIWMKPEVAQARIKDIQDELLEDMAETQALEKIQESGIDKHFKKNLALEKKKQLSELKKSIEPSSNTFAELPDATKFDGKIAKNPATGERMKSVNGKWEPIKE